VNGSVYRRNDTGLWAYRSDVDADSLTGKRRRFPKSGFATKPRLQVPCERRFRVTSGAGP
jgi:hypothetical protein